jgi:hypothetical protein
MFIGGELLKSGFKRLTRNTKLAGIILKRNEAETGKEVSDEVKNEFYKTDPVVARDDIKNEGYMDMSEYEWHQRTDADDDVPMAFASDEAGTVKDAYDGIVEVLGDDIANIDTLSIPEQVELLLLSGPGEVGSKTLFGAIRDIVEANPDLADTGYFKILRTILQTPELKNILNETFDWRKKDQVKNWQFRLDTELESAGNTGLSSGVLDLNPMEIRKRNESIFQVFMHEVVHVMTVKFMNANEGISKLIIGALDKERNAFVNDLRIESDELAQELIDLLETKYKDNLPSKINEFVKKLEGMGINANYHYLYGLVNEREFVSQILTSPQFHKAMRNEMADGLEHAYDGETVFDYVTTLMRFKDGHQNLKNKLIHPENGKQVDMGDEVKRRTESAKSNMVKAIAKEKKPRD